MKAYVLHGIHDLRYEDVSCPVIEKGWVLVRVKAAGICSSDIPRIFTKGTYHFPTIPGHEFSGVVEKVADASQEHWLNKRVSVFPLIPCGKCESCKKHKYEMCESYDYIGSRRDGAFAEYVAVPEWNLFALPDNISFRTAAMFEPLAVSLHAVKKLEIKPGERVAVIGTGLIGFAMAQWAKYLGAGDVCVIGRSEEKGQIAQELNGIRYLYGEAGWKESFHKVAEVVGSESSLQQAVSITAAEGRIVLTGNPQGDMKLLQNQYWRILRKQLSVCGSWNSSYESQGPSDWHEVSAAIEQQKIQVDELITHCFAQDELDKALNLMVEHKEMYCRVMIEWQ